jgi:hypothetical protein
MIHTLKTLPRFFDAVDNEIKMFEVRKDDRNFQVGDTLKLCEYKPDEAGEVRICWRVITYKLTHEDFPDGIQPGYCVLGIRKID